MSGVAAGERLLAADELAGLRALGPADRRPPGGSLRRHARRRARRRRATRAGSGARTAARSSASRASKRQDDGGAAHRRDGARGPGRSVRAAGRVAGERRPATWSWRSRATGRSRSWSRSGSSGASGCTACDGTVVELSLDDVEVVSAAASWSASRSSRPRSARATRPCSGRWPSCWARSRSWCPAGSSQAGAGDGGGAPRARGDATAARVRRCRPRRSSWTRP